MAVRAGSVKYADRRETPMFELIRTNDAVLISWLQAQLQALDIEVLVLDEHMSAMDGSILAIPRRIMVPDADRVQAQALLAEADQLAAQNSDTED